MSEFSDNFIYNESLLIKGDNHGRSNRSGRNAKNQEEPRKEEEPMMRLEEPKKKKEFKLTALNTDNCIVEIHVHECPHCAELIPKVENCPRCGAAYVHLDTVENFRTGYLHYIYECRCPPQERKAQKILKITEVVDESRINIRKNLADDFLKSGGY